MTPRDRAPASPADPHERKLTGTDVVPHAHAYDDDDFQPDCAYWPGCVKEGS
jgi:hypothetical protein